MVNLEILYNAFEQITICYIQTAVEGIGVLTKLREWRRDDPTVQANITALINLELQNIEEAKRNIEHDRKTLAELTRVSRG